jgi:hypothetical protein
MRLRLREMMLLSLWIPILAFMAGELCRFWGILR